MPSLDVTISMVCPNLETSLKCCVNTKTKNKKKEREKKERECHRTVHKQVLTFMTDVTKTHLTNCTSIKYLWGHQNVVKPRSILKHPLQNSVQFPSFLLTRAPGVPAKCEVFFFCRYHLLYSKKHQGQSATLIQQIKSTFFR